jgi:LmbE family N-acetylglucosaminyl deacetylase
MFKKPISGGFDTRVRGTSLRRWSAYVQNWGSWRPPEAPLVVVAPHPDDETLGAGGLIFSWAKMGQPVSVVSVTDGEASHPGNPTVAATRRCEQRRSLRILGSDAVELRRLGLPDGQVRFHESALRDVLLAVSKDATMIAPFEQDGHPDHEAVGRICAEVATENGIRLARYPVWAWHQSDPESLCGHRWGRFRLNRPAQEAKRSAIRCFESQLSASDSQAIVPPHVLAYFLRPFEAFVL